MDEILVSGADVRLRLRVGDARRARRIGAVDQGAHHGDTRARAVAEQNELDVPIPELLRRFPDLPRAAPEGEPDLADLVFLLVLRRVDAGRLGTGSEQQRQELRVIGNLLDVAGFDYVSSEDVRDELAEQLGDISPNNDYSGTDKHGRPNGADAPSAEVDVALYSVDGLVRRAAALQMTPEAKRAADKGGDA